MFIKFHIHEKDAIHALGTAWTGRVENEAADILEFQKAQEKLSLKISKISILCVY